MIFSITAPDGSGTRTLPENNRTKSDGAHYCKTPVTPGYQKVDLEFKNLTYTIRSRSTWHSWRKDHEKVLLDNVSGRIYNGELTAIMGASGAGKSTLMNVLAGYRMQNVTSGKIMVNGTDRDLNKFRKMSCYIMQDGDLLPHLSVHESMLVSANLKLPEKVSQKKKTDLVLEILENLGLRECLKTKVGSLSGGQRKRLGIALELVNNPPIMIFDEPTSGLDSMSSWQCITLLRGLALEGRTIICTIHQPSAKLFEMFDKLFVLADGHCIYKGPTDGLVPYLKQHELHCPTYHNPADFIIEAACGEYGDYVLGLAKSVRNGECDMFDLKVDNGSSNNDSVEVIGERSERSGVPSSSISKVSNGFLMKSMSQNSGHWGSYATSTWTQFVVLLVRTFKCIIRDTNLTQLRFISHILVGVLIGLLYYGIGNQATKVINNTASIFFTILFLMFTALMPTVVTFPIERTVCVREHLNYWYSLKAYYLAKTMADMPFQIIFPIVYSAIVYWMTGQPADITRFLLTLMFSVGISAAAQALGLLIGAATSMQVAVFLGPVTAIPVLLFSGFFVTFSTIPVYLKPITFISYTRYAFEGQLQVIYGLDRPHLECDVMNSSMCLYTDPQNVLKQLDVEDAKWWVDILVLFAFFCVFRIAAFLVLKLKVRSES